MTHDGSMGRIDGRRDDPAPPMLLDRDPELLRGERLIALLQSGPVSLEARPRGLWDALTDWAWAVLLVAALTAGAALACAALGQIAALLRLAWLAGHGG